MQRIDTFKGSETPMLTVVTANAACQLLCQKYTNKSTGVLVYYGVPVTVSQLIHVKQQLIEKFSLN